MAKWQHVIWREWRYSQDEEYARQLYELVADEPAPLMSLGVIIFFSTITGAAIGLVGALVVSQRVLVMQYLMLTGAAIGFVRGCFVGWRLSWRAYLSRLGASLPVGSPDDWLGGGVLLMGLGTLTMGPPFWMVLMALFWGVGGLINWLNTGFKPPTNEYTYRIWFFWWYGIPSRSQLMAALQQAGHDRPASNQIWATPLRLMLTPPSPAGAPQKAIGQLGHDDWLVRLTARQQLIARGEEALPPLQTIALEEDNPLQPTAKWVLKLIKAEQK